MKELPRFAPRQYEHVLSLMGHVLTREHPYLVDLIAYPDGHYRAVFDAAYFRLEEGQTQPSRSQWSTFKKHLKRHDPLLFVFKETGEADCAASASGRCYTVDFGFFVD